MIRAPVAKANQADAYRIANQDSLLSMRVLSSAPETCPQTKLRCFPRLSLTRRWRETRPPDTVELPLRD